jgi:dipeptidyl aminopeptidase/acylaminoacyl peptidase
MRRLKFIAVGILLAATVGCMKKQNESGYIGPQKVEIGERMTPEILLTLGRLSDPQLSPDGSKILFGVSYQSIEKNKSCRNLFLCNTDGSGRVQLTRYAKSVNCARWSNDGKTIYFVQDGQIWKAPLKGGKLGKKVQISNVPAGVSEFAISPDGARIMYVSSIPSALETPAKKGLDKAQAYATEDLMYRHWDHWITEVPRTFVAELSENITLENSVDILGTDELFELPTEPFGGIEQLGWAPDSRHIAYSCRKLTGRKYAFSTNTEIYIYDLVSGNTVEIPMGGGYDTDPVWSPDGKHLAWISMERDGYEADQQRLMVCSVDLSTPETPVVSDIKRLGADFDHDCAGIVWNGNEEIYFNSLMNEAVQSILRTDLSGKIERVTPGDLLYDFNSPFGIIPTENGVKLLTSYASLNFPTELVAVNALDDGSVSLERISHENDAIFAQLTDPVSESWQLTTVDGKSMQAWVTFPPHFDASKQYPAITIVLGGPQGTNSQDWSYRWCYRLMAEQGYIVIRPNRRGTTAFGQEWKEQISGDYIGLNMQDYLVAAKTLKAKPYVTKMACCGASYGGYSAYYLMGIHGDVFDCFISHAGIFDEAGLWFTTEEMFFPNFDNGGLQIAEFANDLTIGKHMGKTGENAWGGIAQAGAPYSKAPKAVRHYTNSPKDLIENWHTPILCIHGELDYRIPYTQGMAAFNAAQMMGVPSRLIIFPEETHWVLQPQNALYWHRNYYDWLDKWCK